MAELIALLQAAFPTTVAGGGLFGIYMYFRKIDAAIKDDLRATINTQAEQIEKLWTECRRLRAELLGQKPDDDGGGTA